MYKTLYFGDLVSIILLSSQKPCTEGIDIPVLQMRALKLGEDKGCPSNYPCLIQGRTDINSRLSESRVWSLSPHPTASPTLF